ncbi:hypothetical protein PSBY109024_17510 [Pseudoalteromonas byunsanensis]
MKPLPCKHVVQFKISGQVYDRNEYVDLEAVKTAIENRYTTSDDAQVTVTLEKAYIIFKPQVLSGNVLIRWEGNGSARYFRGNDVDWNMANTQNEKDDVIIQSIFNAFDQALDTRAYCQ